MKLTYDELRDMALDGDTLMIEGTGPFSMLVRILTGRSISHIAMLIWIGDGLWVIEMREFTGVRLTPASQWIDHYASIATVYFGKAPDSIRAQGRDRIVERALAQRWIRYNYFELLLLWLSRMFGFKWRGGRVCSTLIARCWSAGDGMQFMRPPFPGDFLSLSVWVAAVEALEAL